MSRLICSGNFSIFIAPIKAGTEALVTRQSALLVTQQETRVRPQEDRAPPNTCCLSDLTVPLISGGQGLLKEK